MSAETLPGRSFEMPLPNGRSSRPVGPDLVEAERAAAQFLAALGVVLDSPHLRDTPRRMAVAFAELLTAPVFEPTLFSNDGYEGLVIVGGIPFQSLCAHHVLPFAGTIDIGYAPTTQIVGLSKLAWVAQTFSRRLQVQERLTGQIADWLVEHVGPSAVAVRVRADHACMSLRGVRARGAVTTTFATRGSAAENPVFRQQWASHLSGSA